MGADLFHADRWTDILTDMTKPIVASRNFYKLSQKYSKNLRNPMIHYHIHKIEPVSPRQINPSHSPSSSLKFQICTVFCPWVFQVASFLQVS